MVVNLTIEVKYQCENEISCSVNLYNKKILY